ncbi:unnamed protein product [Linum trigynum]|uniref:Uncharacterized protein n=1 Tax=Linum trigynum TaxID=586398 RepID=A0AAV2CY65_9ROSI
MTQSTIWVSDFFKNLAGGEKGLTIQLVVRSFPFSSNKGKILSSDLNTRKAEKNPCVGEFCLADPTLAQLMGLVAGERALVKAT